MKKWKILSKLQIKDKELKTGDLIKILLKNRGIRTKKEVEEFLTTQLKNVTPDTVGINGNNLKKAIVRIKEAIKKKEDFVIFGDYDVDGICASAILWETLFKMGGRVTPYIPHRIDEGYGLSEKGITNLLLQNKKCKLIITVDNGIVADKAVDFAKKLGLDVIITDHHTIGEKKPEAHSIVHTTQLCGAGVAWMLAEELKKGSGKFKEFENNHLELVALATVADLVPLKNANRTLLIAGLSQLHKTNRVGLLELFKEASIDKEKIDVYEIGHIIAPRLNAVGRLDFAMDSLRLLCTSSRQKAETFAKKLSLVNKERQLLTAQAAEHAISSVKNKKELKKLLFVVHESYKQGVIGLVAGKLVEEFYRPAIVISKGEKYSKASARSVSGFNIVDFIRTVSEFLVDIGGHPMAAGFTVETKKIPMLEKLINKKIKGAIDMEILVRKLIIDCEIPLSSITDNTYEEIRKLSPFGMGNPEPTFISKNVVINDMRLVGRDASHLKLIVGEGDYSIDAIGFRLGEKSSILRIGHKINIVYTIEKDEWNNRDRLQLMLKDIG